MPRIVSNISFVKFLFDFNLILFVISMLLLKMQKKPIAGDGISISCFVVHISMSYLIYFLRPYPNQIAILRFYDINPINGRSHRN